MSSVGRRATPSRSSSAVGRRRAPEDGALAGEHRGQGLARAPRRRGGRRWGRGSRCAARRAAGRRGGPRVRPRRSGPLAADAAGARCRSEPRRARRSRDAGRPALAQPVRRRRRGRARTSGATSHPRLRSSPDRPSRPASLRLLLAAPRQAGLGLADLALHARAVQLALLVLALQGLAASSSSASRTRARARFRMSPRWSSTTAFARLLDQGLAHRLLGRAPAGPAGRAPSPGCPGRRRSRGRGPPPSR